MLLKQSAPNITQYVTCHTIVVYWFDISHTISISVSSKLVNPPHDSASTANSLSTRVHKQLLCLPFRLLSSTHIRLHSSTLTELLSSLQPSSRLPLTMIKTHCINKLCTPWSALTSSYQDCWFCSADCWRQWRHLQCASEGSQHSMDWPEQPVWGRVGAGQPASAAP